MIVVDCEGVTVPFRVYIGDLDSHMPNMGPCIPPNFAS